MKLTPLLVGACLATACASAAPPSQTTEVVMPASAAEHDAPEAVDSPPVAAVQDECGRGIPNAVLTQAILDAAQQARDCYRQELGKSFQSGAEPEGRLMFRVDVAHDGVVKQALVTEDQVAVPALTQCIIDMFSHTAFPPTDEGCVIYNVPVAFVVRRKSP